MIRSTIFLLLLNAFFSQKSLAQEIITNQYSGLFEQESVSYADAMNNKSGLEKAFASMFLFYKNFISSQDASSCVFEPSCSVHGIQAIKKMGVLRGGMATMDRLTRCHPLNSKNYERDPKTGLLLDPVN